MECFSLGSSSFPNKSFLSGESRRIPPKSQSDFWYLGWILRGFRCRVTPLTQHSHISGAGSTGVQPRHSGQPHAHSPPWCPASPGLPPQPLPSPHTQGIHSQSVPLRSGCRRGRTSPRYRWLVNFPTPLKKHHCIFGFFKENVYL